MPQAIKITDAKAAVDEEWKKLETIPAWKLEKVKSKKEVILEAQRDKKKVHFATLMDTCHSKNAELETKLQTCNGRVVLRGDIVKDDSGACAVFAELGSSTSQMTTAKVMDVIARVPDYDGQAADAVSAYTQVKLEDAPRFTESIATPSWIGVGWWANTEYAGFTAVLTEDRRERQVPITSLSLWTRKTWCQVHLIFEKKCREPCPQCSHTNESRVKSHIPTETAFLQDVNQFNGKGETFLRFSDPEEAARLVLEEQRDHLLAEAKSEIFKQECKLDTLNTCILELQRQAHSNLVEMDDVNYGYEESRREHARLHEELAQREKASRNSHPKYPWSGRIEESSGNANWRILQAWIERKSRYYTGAHFTNTGVQERMKLFERVQRMPRCRIDLQWKIIQRFQSTGNCSKSWWNAEQRPKSATWNMEIAHCDTLTWPGLQVRPWMCCWKAAWTIIGISKETETCQMCGQVSHDSQYWMKKLQTDIHGPVSGWQRNKQHQGPITCGQRTGKTC